jgi:hypothetical protein
MYHPLRYLQKMSLGGGVCAKKKRGFLKGLALMGATFFTLLLYENSFFVIIFLTSVIFSLTLGAHFLPAK